MRMVRTSKGKLLTAATLAVLLFGRELGARKFYDDDPLRKMPRPRQVEKVKSRKLSDYYDFFYNTLAKPGERNTKTRKIPARAVSTLGEVPDSEWYTNRQPLTTEELVRGPGNENPPDTTGTLTVIGAKTQGISPGFTVRDSHGRRYMVKFDPMKNPEMATAAEVISTKFFYALGYNVPENYLFTFSREQLVVAPDATLKDAQGRRRPMTDRDVTDLLLDVPRIRDGRYRAVASLYLKGTNVGEFRYHGTRRDDPNDIVPHEHRRDLRGLSVFCAWLNHDDSRAVNTLDLLVEENGIRFLKHYFIDFGATLGSSTSRPNSPRAGNEYMFAWKPAALQFLTFGLFLPRWARAKFPNYPSVGRFEADVFDAVNWVPEYYNAAFSNRLPDDAFWAAKQVMAFTDDHIRAVVKTGRYSDPEAESWVVTCLIKRRDKIGRGFFSQVLPLDQFAVRDGRLVFEDLAVKHRFVAPREYAIQWSRFDNDAERKTPLAGETTFALPRQIRDSASGSYFAADISGSEKDRTVTVYLRKQADRVEVVGIDRNW